MEQDDPPQPTYQSFRLAHLSTPGDIVRIETVYHSIARQQVVFWDDVLVVFPRVRWIEYGNMIPAFLRGEDYSRYADSWCIFSSNLFHRDDVYP